MNDLILKLARQSRLAELYDRYVESAMKAGDDDIMEFDQIVGGFAELIVEECASVASDTDLEDVEGGDSAVLCAASYQIRSHFGIQ